MATLYPMDSTPEEVYAVTSGKNIKLRFNNGRDIIERYIDVVGVDASDDIRIYTIRKTTYKDGVEKGISSATLAENRMLYTTSTVNDDIYRVLRILRKNGYVITHPKKEIKSK